MCANLGSHRDLFFPIISSGLERQVWGSERQSARGGPHAAIWRRWVEANEWKGETKETNGDEDEREEVEKRRWACRARDV